MNVSALITTTAIVMFLSCCAINRTIVTRDIYKIDKQELASIEYLMGESINSFVGVRESLAISDDELAGEEAVRAYVSALAAYHQLPDIVETEQTLAANGMILEEKISFSKSSMILVVKDISQKSEDKLQVLNAYAHLESAKLALVNGDNEEMIYHAEIAKKGLYFNMIEVDVEQIYLSSEDILFKVRRGYTEQAQMEIMKSVNHMKENRQYNKDAVLAH